MQGDQMILPKEHHLILPLTRAATPGKQLLVNGGGIADSWWSVPPGHARYLHYPYSHIRRRRR